MKKKVLLMLMVITLSLIAFGIISVSAGTYENLTYTITNDEVTITGCDSSAQTVIIPDKIENYPVTKIGSSAFSDCKSLTDVTIPDSVTSIGNYAFYNCSSLTSVTIPDGVTSIGNYTFYGCYDLKSITIPDSVISIGSGAFSDCENLKSITIPDSVTSIGDYTFSQCNTLTDITIPDGITSIGRCAFERCTSLTEISIPDSVTSIGDYTFYYCENLTNITIPGSVISIGGGAFYGCENLTSITIPDSVTSIGNYAFSGCTSLTSITIPDSVISIGSGAFSYCTSITSITIPESVAYIGNYAFESCKNITSITIPDSVTSIGNYAFSQCDNLMDINVDSNNTAYASLNGILYSKDKTTLIQYAIGKTDTSFTISDSVTSIDGGAFRWCKSLKSITIPSSVTTIGDYAFSDCTQLKTVYYFGTDEQWSEIYIGNGNDYLLSANRINMLAPMTQTTLSSDKMTFTINFLNIEPGKAVILALYNGKKLVDIKAATYQGESLTLTTDKPWTSAKVMVWESIENISPITKCENVNLNSGGGGAYIPSTPTTYTVIFNSHGGSSVQNVTVTSGSIVSAPADPVKDMYIFTGWHTDYACTNLYDFTLPVTNSFTLHAGWEDDLAAINAQKVSDLIILKDALAETTFDIQPHTDMANLIIDTLDGAIADGQSGIIITNDYISEAYADNSIQIKQIWENELFVNVYVDERQDFKDKMLNVFADAQSNGYSMSLSETYVLFRAIYNG